MTVFSTLVWLEVRKHGLLMLFLGLGVLAWYWLAGSLLGVVRLEDGPQDALLAVMFATIGLSLGGTMTFLAFQGNNFTQEYRAGRLGLLLGAPIAGGWHILARVAVSLVFLSLFYCGMWTVMSYWLSTLGLMLPLELGIKFWLFGLAGLPLIMTALFIGLVGTAYLPRRTESIAGFVAFLGVGQVLEFAMRGVWNQLYTLPAFSLPAPNFSQGISNSETEQLWSIFPGLPSEVTLILLALSGVLFFLLNRIWPEVEA